MQRTPIDVALHLVCAQVTEPTCRSFATVKRMLVSLRPAIGEGIAGTVRKLCPSAEVVESRFFWEITRIKLPDGTTISVFVRPSNEPRFRLSLWIDRPLLGGRATEAGGSLHGTICEVAGQLNAALARK